MTKVAVYRYEISDRRTAKPAQAARMGTVEAIRRAKGSAILESRCLVDESELDSDGFVKETAPADGSESEVKGV